VSAKPHSLWPRQRVAEWGFVIIMEKASTFFASFFIASLFVCLIGFPVHVVQAGAISEDWPDVLTCDDDGTLNALYLQYDAGAGFWVYYSNPFVELFVDYDSREINDPYTFCDIGGGESIDDPEFEQINFGESSSGGGDSATTTAASSDAAIAQVQTQLLFYGMLVFLVTFAIVIFYFRRYD